METLAKIDLSDYVPIQQTIVREDKILQDDWVYPNEYAIIRRPDFEQEFEYRAQKVINSYRTNIQVAKYPNAYYVVEVCINGVLRSYYSSALKKIE